MQQHISNTTDAIQGRSDQTCNIFFNQTRKCEEIMNLYNIQIRVRNENPHFAPLIILPEFWLSTIFRTKDLLSSRYCIKNQVHDIWYYSYKTQLSNILKLNLILPIVTTLPICLLSSSIIGRSHDSLSQPNIINFL